MNTDIDAKEVAAWSKAYRRDQGLSQRQLAAKVKTTPGVIGELERERVRSARVAKEIRALALATTAAEV
jgi:ribosome-binding protein aMBF1 (putative translation factor)